MARTTKEPAKKVPAKAAKATKTAIPAKKATPAQKAAPAAAKGGQKAAPAPAKAAAKSPTRAPATAAGSKAPAARTTKAAVKRSAKAAPLDKFLQGQRDALLKERETYTRQATTLRAEAEQLAEDREPGDVQFDEESGQGDSMNVERERDLALSAQAMAAVEEIDKALAKIEDGSYGVCERCGENIPKERLKALPYAALCVKCKSGGLGRR